MDALDRWHAGVSSAILPKRAVGAAGERPMDEWRVTRPEPPDRECQTIAFSSSSPITRVQFQRRSFDT
jgi:hypothetical protein